MFEKDTKSARCKNLAAGRLAMREKCSINTSFACYLKMCLPKLQPLSS